jgi:hypothetical protein
MYGVYLFGLQKTASKSVQPFSRSIVTRLAWRTNERRRQNLILITNRFASFTSFNPLRSDNCKMAAPCISYVTTCEPPTNRDLLKAPLIELQITRTRLQNDTTSFYHKFSALQRHQTPRGMQVSVSVKTRDRPGLGLANPGLGTFGSVSVLRKTCTIPLGIFFHFLFCLRKNVGIFCVEICVWSKGNAHRM